ncbi:hypothetical protein RI578_40450 (plasmid) [Streptomyces sp. BB1-1-1]|uniref:hypothetical protein n=1 Tax=unclassified Streptomyces TaxID=2593676 RepID=UPI0028778F23|nr:hypothetical protein [Streptomyces sp. BB1-1-1]WND40564.1 hypothetical protein RI578_40450 [Streptomyces sp. BB1-1-1]
MSEQQTEQQKCLQEYKEAQARRQQSGAEASVQRALAGAHAQTTIPRTTGGGAR